jgi:hypothetical protein
LASNRHLKTAIRNFLSLCVKIAYRCVVFSHIPGGQALALALPNHHLQAGIGSRGSARLGDVQKEN